MSMLTCFSLLHLFSDDTLLQYVTSCSKRLALLLASDDLVSWGSSSPILLLPL